MLVFDGPRPPADGAGRFFVDRGNWTQLDPALAGANRNYPFGERDRDLPYRRFRLVGLFFDAARLEVTFDLDRVDLSSLDSVQEFLCSGDCRRPIKLAFFKNGWVEESFEAPEPALARIDQILPYRGLEMLRKTNIRDRSLDQLEGDLKRAFAAWCADKSRAAFARTAFFEKSVVLERDLFGMRFASVGPRSTPRRYFGEDWGQRTVGRFLSQSTENLDYDRNVGQAFEPAIRSGRPHFDQVVASIERDGLDEWIAYDRIILPFEGALATMSRLRPPSETSFGFLAS